MRVYNLIYHPLSQLDMGRIQILKTDATRYTAHEIDIMCRKCHASLGDILHICPKRLVTKCKNCGEIAEIETSIETYYSTYRFGQ